MPLERLTLLRHAKAEQHSASGKDFDRALTARGHADARETGRRLAAKGFTPELALVSAARRAQETWEEASAAFPEAPSEVTRELFHADARVMLEMARAADAGSVLIVGHNPGMHALVLDLMEQGETDGRVLRAAKDGFPPASAAVFRFEAGSPVCEAFLTRHDADK